ncbi:Imm10 family immunity protein [Actinomadura sp. NPDC000600]|uniref:Imm10 family immunity protein n=1 Tax=Actinomadura sp. NPDC000600 TaxID=3154262 RepID=UPI00339793D8
MAFTFTARAVGAETYEDDECFIAGVAEHEDGSGRQLTFMCSLYEPEDQDIATGMDSYCLVTPGQGTAYGGVREAVLKDRVLRIVVDPSNLEALGLNDSEIEVILDVEETQIRQFREGLRRVLAYGRPSERPAILDL